MNRDDKKIFIICLSILLTVFSAVLVIFIIFVPVEVIYLAIFCIVYSAVFGVFGFFYGLGKVAEAGGRIPDVFRHIADSIKSCQSNKKG